MSIPGGIKSLVLISSIVASGLIGSAQAATNAMTSDQAKTRIEAGIEKAQRALSHHHKAVALKDTADAETTLLNAQGADLFSNAKALGAIKDAHADLLHGKTKNANQALNAALSDMTG